MMSWINDWINTHYRSCGSFNKKEINKFNKNINDFIADRSKTEKLCEFELSDKSFNIYTFNSEIEVLGHYIELIKLWSECDHIVIKM